MHRGVIVLSLALVTSAVAGCSSPSAAFTAGPATSQLILDGAYVLTADVVVIGGQTTNAPVSGSLTNRYKWLGAGKYDETIGGVGQIGGNTVDCTNPNEAEITLADDGRMIATTTIRTGCQPIASVAAYAMTYRIVTGGLQRIMNTTISGQAATVTMTYQKQ